MLVVVCVCVCVFVCVEGGGIVNSTFFIHFSALILKVTEKYICEM